MCGIDQIYTFYKGDNAINRFEIEAKMIKIEWLINASIRY